MVLAIGSFYPSSWASESSPEPSPSVVSVAREYVQKPEGIRELVISPASTALKWAEFGGLLPQMGRECKEILSIVGHVFFWFDLPTDIRKLAEKIDRFKEKFFTGTFWERVTTSKDLFVQSIMIGDLVGESLQLANAKDLIYFSPSQLALLSILGFLGSTSLALLALTGFRTQLHTFLNAEIGSPQFKLAFIKMVGRLCLVAAGVFGMVSFVTGAAVPALAFILISTLLVITTITALFYDKLYVPKPEKEVERKGINKV